MVAGLAAKLRGGRRAILVALQGRQISAATAGSAREHRGVPGGSGGMGYVVAFQASTHHRWITGPGGSTDTGLIGRGRL